MKKKILSLILCLCMCFSLFTGCSLYYTDESYKDDDIVMTVGNTNITREELVSQYNNFYSQYYQYFMYYDNDTMKQLFYSAVESRAVVLEKANELLSDNTIKFYTEDWEDIWNDIYDFINAQLDAKEKAILLQSGVKEKELPKRLQDVDNSKKSYVYKPYEQDTLVKPDYTAEADAELSFNDKYAELKNTAIYTYNAEKDAEKDRDTQNIPDSEKATRTVAFNQYIESLSIAAKAAGKAYDLDSVLKAEVERLYKTYKESALYSKYQEYIEGGIIDEGKLDETAVVTKFIELSNKDTQNNANEESYIDLVTNSSNENLILYHNGGKNTYFTVQHILIKFDDATSEELKQHIGYLSTSDSIYRNEYNQYREYLINELGGKEAMTTSYRDEEGYLVTETVGEGEDAKEVLVKKTVADILKEYQDLVDECAKDGTAATEREKAMIFNKLSWKYSDDTGSLNEKLSAKLGFTIADEVDNHGSYVIDFTNGARELFSDYKNGNVRIGQYLTDYGLHLMLVTGKYTDGTLVEVVNPDNDNEYKDFSVIAEAMRNTYISNMTEQSVYDYIYDSMKTKLVGSSGTYFSTKRNNWVSEYEKDNKINYVYEMSIEELNKAIGV